MKRFSTWQWLASAGILSLAVVAVVFISGRWQRIADWGVMVNGEVISRNESWIYLYMQKVRFEALGGEDIWEIDFDGQSAQSLARQYAVDNVVRIRLSVQEADRLGIQLTEDELNEIQTTSKDLYSQGDVSTDSDQNDDIMINDLIKYNQDYELYTRVFDAVTKDFVPGEDDFQHYFDQYLEENWERLLRIEAQVLWIRMLKEEEGRTVSMNEQEQEAAMETAARLRSALIQLERNLEGDASLLDWEMVLNEMNLEYVQLSRDVLNSSFYPQQVLTAAMELRAGSVSPIIETDRGLYILKVRDIREPDQQQLMEEQLERYTLEKKNDIFDQEYARWYRQADVRVNDEVWDELSYLMGF